MAAGASRPDVAVIGRGLMGTACARHLAEAGFATALIGPDEPRDRRRHDGPFGSHFDAGRITRRIALDADWARLSSRSIDRYGDLARRSGSDFYTACGTLMAGPANGPDAGFAAAFLDVADRLDLPHESLTDGGLVQRFPMLRFPAGTRAAFDPSGGHIDPRAFRRAEETLAVAAGCTLHPEPAVARDGAIITLASGEKVTAGHVVVATGVYAGIGRLLPARPSLKVQARTVLLVESAPEDALRLGNMPTLIFLPETDSHDAYLLPPIRYRDRRWYLKIGGEAEGPALRCAAEIDDWYRSAGSARAAQGLRQTLLRIMPGLRITHSMTDSCAVSFTETGHPYIERLDETVTVLTGGNGAGAKCADELGRLAAIAATGGDLSTEGYDTDFAAVFE